MVFCRFIETAEYLAAELAKRLRRPRTEVQVVTGRLPAAERRDRIQELAEHDRRVLVATDCLSEGINLQEHYTAVVHYDLPWNPTRLEQREGRVDRFGQAADKVAVVTYWGQDNHIDESVLKVLLRKHKAIRGALGVSIPVPGATSAVIDALTENVLLVADMPTQGRFEAIEEALRPQTAELDRRWEQAHQAETRRRSLFAQQRINPDTVAAELDAMREALGSATDVQQFIHQVFDSHGAVRHPPDRTGTTTFDIAELARPVRDLLATDTDHIDVRFSPPATARTALWTRTHPSVGAIAGHVLDTALDPDLPTVERIAARCGVIRTSTVEWRTTLLLCRTRMTITSRGPAGTHHMLAEETLLAAFGGAPQTPEWLPDEETEALLEARPDANVAAAAAAFFITDVLDAQHRWQPHIDGLADQQAERLATSHGRVREADRRRAGTVRHGLTRGGGQVRVQAQTPVDILGVYVYLPLR